MTPTVPSGSRAASSLGSPSFATSTLDPWFDVNVSSSIRSPAAAALMGLFLALPTLGLAAMLPQDRALEWLAIVLGIVAAIYVGFALVDARPSSVRIEVAFAALTVLLALGGLWITPLLMAFGYALHGVWDVLHFWRRPVVSTRVPWWYTAFCLTFDLPVAAYLWWRWT